MKCAAYELPFKEGDTTLCGRDVLPYLEHLKDQNILHKSATGGTGRPTFPSAGVNLRSASADNFVVVDVTEGAKVIGEVDGSRRPC